MMDNEKGTPENLVSKTNWQMCAICQEATSEALQCPARRMSSSLLPEMSRCFENAGKSKAFWKRYSFGCRINDDTESI